MRIDLAGGTKLEFFRDLFEKAKTHAAEAHEKMTRRYDQYLGDDAIDGSSVHASQVRNITYELIESQVSSYIPTPSVTPRVESDITARNAKATESLLRDIRNALPYERLNDLDERYSPIYGGSVWLVEWDESARTHDTVGEAKVSCLPPSDFYGQPFVYEVADMEYCFVRFETTREEISRRYGVTDLDDAESKESSEDTATLYVCYYKDEDDKVCQYVWSGECEILDLDDYYARRRKVCKICEEREGICRCEKPRFVTVSADTETLERDIVLSDGQTVIPAYSQAYENGEPVFTVEKRQAFDADTGEMLIDMSGGLTMPMMVDVQVPKMVPTEIPYYRPKTFPVVIRKNTSRERCLFGESDCDVIRPQQQGINKLESRIQEKLIRAGVVALVPRGHKLDLTSDVLKDVLEVDQGEVSLYGRIDLQVSVQQDIAQSERLYDQAKRILGISATFQGQNDATAQSGRAKALQIQQANGRLDSKRRMKNAAYADIDRILFELYLAYADEPRPFAYRDANGRRQNVQWSRYDFVARGDDGEFYYDDRYLFSADASVDIESSRPTLWEENANAFRVGAYGPPQDIDTLLVYWRNMERAHYPYARENVERFEAIKEQQAALAQAQQQLAAANEEIAGHAEYEEYLKGVINGRGSN